MNFTRREWLGALGLVVLGAGCQNALPRACNEVTGDDAKVRNALGYADFSADADKTCDACAQYVAAAAGECGGCKLMKGPIHPKGSCRAFARAS